MITWKRTKHRIWRHTCYG